MQMLCKCCTQTGCVGCKTRALIAHFTSDTADHPGFVPATIFLFLFYRIMSSVRKLAQPHFAKGEVIKGFGRGSKELGIPTANFPQTVVDSLPDDFGTGVYFGFANVNKGQVLKMVMSVGWNPYFNNTTKSMETHIMHKFNEDFYGKELRVAILGYIRPEENFDSLEALIETINNDIKIADTELDKNEYLNHKSSNFFTD